MEERERATIVLRVKKRVVLQQYGDCHVAPVEREGGNNVVDKGGTTQHSGAGWMEGGGYIVSPAEGEATNPDVTRKREAA